MATRAANKRLTREYQTIQANPPPFIVAHPSESNILEWHYILTGPPNTPYHNGQYWGTLLFPPTYPFAPPAIRMHTPSGRFQPSTRLCLSISDFHPKSFNPAWEVSTILIGLMSFMTSDEMTTGSLGSTDAERKWYAARSRWWNSTGGGSATNPVKGNHATVRGVGAVKAGDGGVKFRAEWFELDTENWEWMKKNNVDPATGQIIQSTAEGGSNVACSPEVAALRRGPAGSTAGLGDAGRAARDAGGGWLWRNKYLVAFVAMVGWVTLQRLLPGVDD
ncbi:MAG: hypothetical protein Q9164_003170 [Protoblastenia rupestris]